MSTSPATAMITAVTAVAAIGTGRTPDRVGPDSDVARVLDEADPGPDAARFGDLGQALLGTDGGATGALGGDLDRLLGQFESMTRTLLGVRTVAAALRQVVHAGGLIVSDCDLVGVTLRDPHGRSSPPPTPTRSPSSSTRSSPGPAKARAWMSPARRGPAMSRATTCASSSAGHGSPGARSTTATARSSAPNWSRPEDPRGSDTRDVIGQAKGILMNRRGITDDEAFELLRRTSQDLNVKLVDLAHTLTARHSDLD